MDRLIYTAMTGANAAAQPPGRAVQQPGQRLDQRLSRRAVHLPRRAAARRRRHHPRVRAGSHRRPLGHARPGPAHRPQPGRHATGNGWFAVQGLDGTEAYTRNGALRSVAAGRHAEDQHRPARAVRRRRARSPCPPELGHRHRRRRHHQRQGRQPARQQRGPPQAGHAHAPKTRSSAATTACFAPLRATRCPTTPPPACRSACSKAPTSTPSRPWSA